MSGLSECPSDALLAAILDGAETPPGVGVHLDACDACRRRMESMEADEAFLGRLRALTFDTLGPLGSPRVPGYTVQEELSSGAQGVVYRAVQDSTQRPVAIKTVRTGAQGQEQRARARREVEIIARLDHPGIIRVYESRELSDGRLAVIMEYVDGTTLDQWCTGIATEERRRRLLEVFERVCIAVHHAHLNSVIHRDLKPENIIVEEGGRPVVLDFGIARMGEASMTRTGEFAGTPAYASPEQAGGHPGEVDALTDVYSLGVILYCLLLNEPPYALDGSIFDMVRVIREVEPVRPRQRDPRLSADVEAIVLRALRKEKYARYQSAESLGRDIRRYLDGLPVEARSGSGWYLLRKAVAVNRNRLAASAALVLALLTMIGVVAVSISGMAEAARREQAERESARLQRIRAQAVTEILRDTLPVAAPAEYGSNGALNAGLHRLHQRLESGVFSDAPELDQEIRRLWGDIYTDLGGGRVVDLVEFAELSLRTGMIRLRQQHGATPNVEVAASMHQLAGVLLVRQRLEEADSLIARTCEMRLALHGADSPELGESLALRARILAAAKHHEEALARAEEALRIFELQPAGDASMAIAGMLALKAQLSLDRGEPEQAEPWIRESIRVRLQRLSPDDTDLLDSLTQVAQLATMAPQAHLVSELREAWGGIEASAFAERLLEDVSDLRRADPSFGASGPVRTGRTHAFGRLLKVYEVILGPEHPALVGVLMAQAQAAQYEYLVRERAAAARRAADLLAARFGENDLSVLNCLDLAAAIEAYAGEAGSAAELERRVVAIWQALPAEAVDPLLTLNCRRKLAWYLDMDGQFTEAGTVYDETLAALLEILDEEHYLVALTRAGRAMNHANMGELASADRLSEVAAVAVARVEVVPPDTRAHIEFIRGHVLVQQGRFVEARPYLDAAWSRFYHFAGPVFLWQPIILSDLARVCDALGDAAGADEWRRRLTPRDADAAPME